ASWKRTPALPPRWSGRVSSSVRSARAAIFSASTCKKAGAMPAFSLPRQRVTPSGRLLVRHAPALGIHRFAREQLTRPARRTLLALVESAVGADIALLVLGIVAAGRILDVMQRLGHRVGFAQCRQIGGTGKARKCAGTGHGRHSGGTGGQLQEMTT